MPRIAKWPFFAGDLLLLLVAGWVVHGQSVQLDAWQATLVVMSVALGAWLGAMPFVMEYRAALRFVEADRLTSAVTQIEKLEAVGAMIKIATGQWQTVQEHCEKAVSAASAVSDSMVAEAKNFAEFLQKANDTEKAHLRLEVDKARRAESEWLQILVRLFDHIYALYMAGARSGQPALSQQLTNFQAACREIVRRVGLVPIEAREDEPFDETKHQLAESGVQPASGARIAETVATGYTFQGQPLRAPIVRVKSPAPADAAPVSEAVPAESPETIAPANPTPAPDLLDDSDSQLELGAGS